MTRAIFIDEIGGPENFTARNHDLPPPGAGEIRVRHSAIGLNFIDIYQRTGLYPVALPAILGSEAVGIVEAVGAGAQGFEPRDRVVYLAGGGAYSQAANAPAAMSAKIPDRVSFDAAAAMFLKGLTAEMLVRQIFKLGPDHTCLIHAAAGGVGAILCQWANHIGARVIGVVGGEEKIAIAKSCGADDVIVRTETDSIAAEVRKLSGGKGVDVVYDGVGAATFEASLDSLAPRGMMVSYGNASGPVPAFAPLELTRRGSLSFVRPSLFHFATPDALPGMAETLFELVAKGALKPKIGEVFQLDKVADAHRLLESGKSTGAIILRP